MAMHTWTVEFNDDETVTLRGPEGVRNMKVAEFTAKLAAASGTVVEKHAAHSHIFLDAGTGKMTHEEHEHQ